QTNMVDVLTGIYAVTFTVKNNCPYTVWPGTLTSSGPALHDTGFELASQGTQTLHVQASWSGRLWGRTGCSTDQSGKFTCATADCASGQIPCNGAGAIPPATLMEITLNGHGGLDFYDISLVDGFNVPISMTPSNPGCSVTSCPANVNAACPPELAIKGADGSVIACKSACLAFGDPRLIVMLMTIRLALLPAPLVATTWLTFARDGRLWGRTGCSTDHSGKFTCATGDCASGQIPCNGAGGIPPATLMEITLNGYGGQDFYDISLVDGFNVPISMTPSNQGCSATSCPANVNAACPPELAVKGAHGSVIACKSACLAFGDPRYCCSGDHSTPETCPPTQYSAMFKTQCPQAYSYAYDDKTSGIPPTTLLEFTLSGSGGPDFYDVSLVDGFNLPASIQSEGCNSTSCPSNVNNVCPPELAVEGSDKSVVACKSACLAFNQPQYCCTGDYATPDTCPPTKYSKIFKTACPLAYSYAYDDKTSTFTCKSRANYAITFCP
ncbi:Thaumatin family, partial [Dillenia turbinata]